MSDNDKAGCRIGFGAADNGDADHSSTVTNDFGHIRPEERAFDEGLTPLRERP